ncbi:MAG TPA: hypothetical protein VMU93_03920 [Caulobacteraceae bacterium]|nr:hypothetical protein [Caulobacteraceae bacterium]
MPQLTHIAAATAAALASLAAAFPIAEAQPPHRGGACLNLGDIQGQRVANDHTVYLREGGRIWRLGFANACADARNETLIMHPVANNGVICSAIELNVRVRRTGQACVADSLTRLTPEAAAALPRRDRP